MTAPRAPSLDFLGAGRLVTLASGAPVYVVATLAFALYNAIGLAVLFAPGFEDYWEHLAALEALARQPFAPEVPYIAGASATHLFTPYHLAWALVARLVHVHPFAVLPVMGLVNSLLFGWACRAVARRLLGDARLALPVALTLLLLWEPQAFHWSGFYYLAFLPLAACYPFWFALPIALLLLSYADAPAYVSPWRGAGIGAAVGLLLLIHPLTACFAAIMLPLRALHEAGFVGAARAAGWIAGGLLTALAWPYFPVLATVASSQRFGKVGFAGDVDLFLAWIPRMALPAVLLGLWPIVDRVRTGRVDVVVSGALVFVVLFTLDVVWVRNALIARLGLFAILCLQLALVRGLVECPRWPRAAPALVVLYVALLLPLGWLHAKRSLTYVVPSVSATDPVDGSRSNRDYVARYQRLAPSITPADVVLAPLRESWRIPAILGCKVVGAAHSTPFVSDYFARNDDDRRFFALETPPAVRAAILARYHVTRIVAPRRVVRPAGFEAGLVRIGGDDAYDVFAIAKP